MGQHETEFTGRKLIKTLFIEKQSGRLPIQKIHFVNWLVCFT